MAVEIFSWPSLQERMCWTWGSNSGLLACQADTLPIELPRLAWFHSEKFVSSFSATAWNDHKQAPPLENALKCYQTLEICISRQILGWREFILEKHLRSILFIRICWFLVIVFDSGLNFVSHQNSCFASLAGMTSHCSSDQLPKSVWAIVLQLVVEKKIFEGFLPYKGMMAILVTWPRLFKKKKIIPHPYEALFEIWLWLAQRFLRRRSLKSVDDRRQRNLPIL